MKEAGGSFITRDVRVVLLHGGCVPLALEKYIHGITMFTILRIETTLGDSCHIPSIHFGANKAIRMSTCRMN